MGVMPLPDAPTTSATAAGAVAGVVLAAGAGSRYGQPKALVRGDDGTAWLVRTIETLQTAGCSPVLVVLGARAADAEALLAAAEPPLGSVTVVRADDWAQGLSASLRAALTAADRLAAPPTALAVVPVDVPDLNPATVRRLLELPGSGNPAPHVTADTLRQAVFDGRPGHPVLIGRAHWARLLTTLTGDTGARHYLAAAAVEQVECADLSTGRDVDVPR